MKRSEAVKSIDGWLDRLGMSEHRNKRLDTLSKGNQQKIQLVTALAHNPQVIILDEPFSGLDPVNAMLLKDIVKEEIAKGKIVEFCDGIAILNGGSLVLEGDIYEIKRNYVRDKLIVRSPQAEEIRKDLGSCCTAREGRELLIKLGSVEEKQGMMRSLTEKYDLDEVRVFEPSLNDIFVEYAKEQN